MSLAINVEKIYAVLIAGVWYPVAKGKDGTSSFDLDAYEFLDGENTIERDARTLLGGGTVEGVPMTGFYFRVDRSKRKMFDSGEGSYCMFGPITSIQAVLMTRPENL